MLTLNRRRTQPKSRKRNKNDQRSRRTSTFCMLYFTLNSEGPGWLNELDSWITLTTHARLSPIRRGFAPAFVKTMCTRLAASDKVYQVLAHGRWFFSGTPASSTTKTGYHDIVEILLKVALNTINKVKSNHTLNSSGNIQ